MAKKKASRKKPGPAPKLTAEQRAQRHRDAEAARNREASQALRDIANDFPKCQNASRKRACRRDFRKFCESYLPDLFPLNWSPDHFEAINLIEQSVLRGGLFALAMPRGSGKTTLSLAGALWAMLYGHRMFIVIIAASSSKAEALLANLKTTVETNADLNDDFPEVCHPVHKLGRVQHRAKGQTYNGVPTRIEWGSDKIIVADIPKSKASGCIVTTSGMKGSEIRGQQHARSDGSMARPDLCLIDDPQTTESAWSPSQCRQRKSIISGDILGMAGPGKKIAAVMPCTVIRKGDAADEILDREKNPRWQGRRTKMLIAWPVNMELWEQYADIRKAQGIEASTEYYAENRFAMDDGAEVSWLERYEPDELSAIQHAMNLYYDRGPEVFASEFQNEPEDEEDESNCLTAEQVISKQSGLPRFVVPLGCEYLSAFIGVQGELLFWLVLAAAEDFTCAVVDYGTWPSQGHRRYFTLRDAKKKLSDRYPGGLEAILYAGMTDLVDSLAGPKKDGPRVWHREDGAELTIGKIMIDANWGESTSVVKQFCRNSDHRPILTPAHGKFYGASSIPIGATKKKTGERRGDNWFTPPATGGQVRHCVFDTNYWKSFTQNRLATLYPEPGNCSLFKTEPRGHECLADHLTAEFPVEVTGRGREVAEWKLRPNRDNHWLDCLVGAAVAAGMLGAKLPEVGEAKAKRKRERTKLSDLKGKR